MSKGKDFTNETRFRVRVDRGYRWKLRVEFAPVLVACCMTAEELGKKMQKLAEAMEGFSRPTREE